MKNCMITFRSVTLAQRGELLLRRSGVECSLRRTPRRMEQQGCGYSLQLKHEQLMTAVSILQHHGIRYRKLYAVGPDGGYEELEP